jgi:hypothetical protein
MNFEKTKTQVAALTRLLARRPNLCAAVLLAALIIVLFRPVLFGGDVLLGRDFATCFHGVRFFFRESVLAGEFPFWCPYTLGGSPLLASWQAALLYPPSVVWLIFPTTTAYAVFAALHHWMFAWFVFLLARECRAGAVGAWVAACGALACSSLLQVTECLEHLGGFVWLPLILYFWLGLLRGGRGKTAGLAVVLAAMACAGSPYAVLMTTVALAAAGVPFWLLLEKHPPLMVTLARAGLAAGLAFLLAAPQMLPMLELARTVASESLARDPQSQLHYSMWAADWLKTLAPTLFGFPMEVRHVYAGVLTVMLLAFAAAPLAMMLARRRWNAPVAALLALALAGAAMASGPALQLHRLLALAPPVSRLYSYPSTFVILVAVALPVLAGVAVHTLRRLPVRARWWLVGTALAVALAVYLAAPTVETWVDAMRRAPHFTADFRSFTAGMDAFPAATAVNRFLLLWVCSLIAALLLASPRRWKLALTLATVLMLSDKTLLVDDLRLFGKADVYAVETPSMRMLREAGAGHELARVHKTYHMMGETHILSGSRDEREFAWIRDFLPWSVGLPRHFYQTNSSGTLNPPEADHIWLPLLDRFEPWQNDRLRGLWNAKWIMDISRDANGYSHRLRENPQFMPRAWLSSRALPVSDWQEALRLLLDKNFDPRGTALLYVPSVEIPENILNQQAGFAPATSVKQTNNTITIEADAGCDAVLVVADTHYKWWRAEVDGKPARVFKVNMAQKAVLFPAGEHTVRLVCVPVSFYIGCALFVIGLPLTVWLARRKNPPLPGGVVL